MRTRGLFALTLTLAAGVAQADITPPPFLVTNSSRMYTFTGVQPPESYQTIGIADGPANFPAVGKDIDGHTLVHGIRGDGRGEFFRLRGNESNYWLDSIAVTETFYNSFEIVGERMFAIKNLEGYHDAIVELDPVSYAEIGTYGVFELGIGGMAYVPQLNEFIVSDTRTNTFFAIDFGDGSGAGALRTIGHAGMRWGANGLECYDGVVFGSAIRGEDMKLVFGHVNLDTGVFEVETVIGDAVRGSVGFGFVPSPGTLALLGAGGVLAGRRRR
ncbi:MAG: PEP-CTERM sorting domain-containing protein [Leptolyngbya sp. PLA3]|nr:MAG: PEP-CTERM sorting domain-containing protein [Cyanobacteria bacterium CYA]MCE7968782.1 PEP-CTERM sorting domain-containing protein [Leptolyngbya sp. PL-A3]